MATGNSSPANQGSGHGYDAPKPAGPKPKPGGGGESGSGSGSNGVAEESGKGEEEGSRGGARGCCWCGHHHCGEGDDLDNLNKKDKGKEKAAEGDEDEAGPPTRGGAPGGSSSSPARGNGAGASTRCNGGNMTPARSQNTAAHGPTTPASSPARRLRLITSRAPNRGGTSTAPPSPTSPAIRASSSRNGARLEITLREDDTADATSIEVVYNDDANQSDLVAAERVDTFVNDMNEQLNQLADLADSARTAGQQLAGAVQTMRQAITNYTDSEVRAPTPQIAPEDSQVVRSEEGREAPPQAGQQKPPQLVYYPVVSSTVYAQGIVPVRVVAHPGPDDGSPAWVNTFVNHTLPAMGGLASWPPFGAGHPPKQYY